MFMRYRGGGVGHKSIQKKIQKFCDDRWPDELRNTIELSTTTQDPAAQPMDNNAEEATAVPILEPIDPGPGIEDVELPEEAESESDEDDSSEEEGDGSESEGGSDNSDYADY